MPKTNEIPKTMKALAVREYSGGDALDVVELPVPKPRKGQVLVRMSAAPINPADLMFMQGLYGVRKELPAIPGLEGSGTVVASGGGAERALVGKRVACLSSSEGGGTWAEYMLTSASACFPLRRTVSDEAGATLIVNPMTAWGLMDMARKSGARTVAQTAAASALGRMLSRLGKRFGIQMVNIVRRPAHVETLRSDGAKHVLDSSEPGFQERLRELCAKLKASFAFDAVAGEMTGTLLSALSPGGKVVVYGALSLQGCQAGPGDLIFGGKAVDGFWLAYWLGRLSLPQRNRVSGALQGMLDKELRTDVRARMPLTQAKEALQLYVSDMAAGKVLFTPNAAG